MCDQLEIQNKCGFINKYDPHTESCSMVNLELLWEPIQEWNFLI